MAHYRHSVFLSINLGFKLIIAKAYTQPTLLLREEPRKELEK